MGRGHASLQNAQSLLIGLMNTHEDQTLGENGKTARQNIEGKTASKRQNCLASCHVTQPEKKGCFGTCMPRAHRQRKNVPPPGSHTKIAFGEREESEQIKVKSLVLGKSANKQAPEKPKQKTGRKLQKRGVEIIVKKR